MPFTPDLLTTQEAANYLGLERSTIRDYIRRGIFTAVRLDRRTNGIPRAEVERYKVESLGKRGRGGVRRKGLTTGPKRRQDEDVDEDTRRSDR